MNTENIRERLHNYLEIADDKKLKAIYVMVEDEIEDEINETAVEHSIKFKAELDERVNYYLKGGKMITPAEMNKRLQSRRKKRG